MRTIRRIIVPVILLVLAIFVLNTAKYYVRDDITDATNLIINNNNVTARLKEDVIIKDDNIYISIKDLKNFFDNYIYEEPQTNEIITTYDKKIASIGYEEKTIKINGAKKRTFASALKVDDVAYLPILEMLEVYGIEVEHLKDSNTVTIDSLDRKQIKAAISKNVKVKDYAKTLSRSVDNLLKGEMVIVISEDDNGWSKVRTESRKDWIC